MQQTPGGQPPVLSRPRLGPLARAGIPLSSLGALVCLWLVYAMDANCRQIFYYVLPPIVSEFKVDPTAIGVVSTIVTMSVSILALPAGPWFDRGGVLGLYFMVALCLASAVVLLFFTRETVGRFKGRDFGVFSPERCNVDLSTTEEVRS